MRLSELAIFLFNIAVLGFLAFNYNPSLATIYGLFTIAGFVMFKADSLPTVFIEKMPNRLKSFAFGFAGLLIFFAVSNLVLSLFGFIRETFQLNSALELYAETVPYFAQNMFVTFMVFVITIPLIETGFFFGNGAEALKDLLHIPKFRLGDQKTWAVFGIIISAFILLHTTAKAVTSDMTAQLILVGIFALVSLIMVVVEGQLLGAIIFHILANGLGMLSKFGLLTDGLFSTYAIILFGGTAFVFLVLTKQLNIQRIGG